MTKFKPWKIVAIILAALLLAFLIWKLATKPERYFKTITIEHQHIFNTVKERNYLDTIVYAGLVNLSQINDSLIVVIKPLTNEIKSLYPDELELKAKIIGEGNTFIIWTQPDLGRDEYITVLSHELIHLKQYYTKELVVQPGMTPLWQGKLFVVENTAENVANRPWEIDAISKQPMLKSLMLNTLYGQEITQK